MAVVATWVCENCTTLYAVGLFRCPRCHGTDFHEFGSRPEDEEHPMAKIGTHTGVTDKTVTNEAAGQVAGTGDEAGDAPPEPAPDITRPAVNDPKGAWAAWVNHLGGDVGDGDRHTKRQLIGLADKLGGASAEDAGPVDGGGDEDDEPDESEPSDDDE